MSLLINALYTAGEAAAKRFLGSRAGAIPEMLRVQKAKAQLVEGQAQAGLAEQASDSDMSTYPDAGDGGGPGTGGSADGSAAGEDDGGPLSGGFGGEGSGPSSSGGDGAGSGIGEVGGGAGLLEILLRMVEG
ncbi:hypothetical protein ACFU53_26995 [Streptomyces sp. NPDC057474]|uniref:hypothetical protein n=1 Tax=Streptomyces sp. NPDC057474 TaxID=3346144 RepID=UPI003676FE43